MARVLQCLGEREHSVGKPATWWKSTISAIAPTRSGHRQSICRHCLNPCRRLAADSWFDRKGWDGGEALGVARRRRPPDRWSRRSPCDRHETRRPPPGPPCRGGRSATVTRPEQPAARRWSRRSLRDRHGPFASNCGPRVVATERLGTEGGGTASRAVAGRRTAGRGGRSATVQDPRDHRRAAGRGGRAATVTRPESGAIPRPICSISNMFDRINPCPPPPPRHRRCRLAGVAWALSGAPTCSRPPWRWAG